jgi:hypothetical protein
MTVGDWIRSLTDIELAVFLQTTLSERDKVVCEKLAKSHGIKIELIEMPDLSVAKHLKYLRSEIK